MPGAIWFPWLYFSRIVSFLYLFQWMFWSLEESNDLLFFFLFLFSLYSTCSVTFARLNAAMSWLTTGRRHHGSPLLWCQFGMSQNTPCLFFSQSRGKKQLCCVSGWLRLKRRGGTFSLRCIKKQWKQYHATIKNHCWMRQYSKGLLYEYLS